jgi:hypothetical protein
MKTPYKNLLLAILLVAAVLQTTNAGVDFKSYKETPAVTPPLFRNSEIQIDGYYAQVFGPSTTQSTINTGPGGGVGVNVIFARYFGIGVDNTFYSNNNVGTYLLGGQLIARYPIESAHLAPYITVGGGAAFSHSQYGYGSLGLGFEHRLTPNLGFIVEGKWLYGMPNPAGLLKTGIRLSF